MCRRETSGGLLACGNRCLVSDQQNGMPSVAVRATYLHLTRSGQMPQMFRYLQTICRLNNVVIVTVMFSVVWEIVCVWNPFTIYCMFMETAWPLVGLIDSVTTQLIGVCIWYNEGKRPKTWPFSRVIELYSRLTWSVRLHIRVSLQKIIAMGIITFNNWAFPAC